MTTGNGRIPCCRADRISDGRNETWGRSSSWDAASTRRSSESTSTVSTTLKTRRSEWTGVCSTRDPTTTTCSPWSRGPSSTGFTSRWRTTVRRAEMMSVSVFWSLSEHTTWEASRVCSAKMSWRWGRRSVGRLFIWCSRSTTSTRWSTVSSTSRQFPNSVRKLRSYWTAVGSTCSSSVSDVSGPIGPVRTVERTSGSTGSPWCSEHCIITILVRVRFWFPE